MYSFESTSPNQTAEHARRLAPLLHGGEVIELSSDLGGGKTTFVQALAKALGYRDRVTSPTFTLSQIYKLPSKLELHHYDLYRLEQTGIIGLELAEDVGSGDVITVVEWGKVASDVLPSDRLLIQIEVTGPDSRLFKFSGHGKTADRLIKGMSR